MKEVGNYIGDIKPKVSIIILNWNTTSITCALLRSIKSNLTYSNVEIILVDNGSSEDPTDEFLSIFGDIKIVLNPSNYGFSAGCNIGVKEAVGDYYFFLNSDTEITPGLIESLLEAFTIDKKTGIVSPVIYSYNGEHSVEFAGYTRVHPITGRSKIIKVRNNDLHLQGKLSESHFAYGAAMMISKELYETVGGLCEDYFAYYEELDWSNRIREKGYKIYCHNEASVYHKGSMSTATNTPFKTFLLTRNRMLYMKRNSFGINYALFLLYFMLIAAPKRLAGYIFTFQFKNISAYIRALSFHLSGKPEYLYKTNDGKFILIKSTD
jgi:GT2 family glycosyltransferase